MKKLISLLAIATVLISGCGTWSDMPPETKGAISRTMLNSALRLGAYAVVQKNPDLAPYAEAMSMTLATYNAAVDPADVWIILQEQADRRVTDPDDRALVEVLIEDVIDIYNQVYVLYQEDPKADPVLRQMLSELGLAIKEGVQLATINARVAE